MSSPSGGASGASLLLSSAAVVAAHCDGSAVCGVPACGMLGGCCCGCGGVGEAIGSCSVGLELV